MNKELKKQKMNDINKKPENQIIVIFGASGDLTGRKLMPSLYELYIRDLLPEHFCIIGASRTSFTDKSFRTEQKKHILANTKGTKGNGKKMEQFLSSVYYVALDTNRSDQYTLLKEKIESLQKEYKLEDRILYYLSTPPAMYEIIPEYLKENGMNSSAKGKGWRRLIVEKPFGTSLETAQKLNTHLCEIFEEEEIYRIDHYLGKETVQNILVLRFANGIFEPLWNRNYVESIEISASETLGVENRGKYYEGAGAMRDMVQNHLMQLMAYVAMEAPPVFDPEPIRDEIVKVFRSLHHYSEKEIAENIIRAQYEGYREEKDISPKSNTETYVGMKLFVDNWRWNGVPFYIFTGKKLQEKTSEIVVHFKSTPQRLFKGQCSGPSCNKLTIRIQPDESIMLRFGLKEPGAGFVVKQVSMDFRYDSLSKVYLPGAYERLLLDAMLGDSTLYARSDALEASWRFVDPIEACWKKMGEKKLYTYKAGSKGPKEIKTLGSVSFCPCQEWKDD